MSRSFRGSLDPGRLRYLLAGPNADTRTWIALGRIGSTPNDRFYAPPYGWILDTEIVSGPLTGELVACRIPSQTPNSIVPPSPGALVVVLFTDGDPNVQCTILGCLNTIDTPAPVSVNGQGVNEAYASANHIVVDPTLGIDAEMGSQVRVSATTRAALIAPQIALSSDTPTQSYVRGENLQTAINNFANALIATNAYTSSSAVVASPTLVAAVTTLANAIAAALSTKIKGE